MHVRSVFVPLVALAAVGVTACSAPVDAEPAASPSGSASATCDKASLKTQTAGKLTIGTDSPAYEPWFSDNKPNNGKGYESAVAYAIAKQLGYSEADVTWVTVPFNTAVAPAPKNFDLDLNQVSISPERAKAVDFSSGYYEVRQAVITYKGSPIDGKTATADLAGASLGAQVGTTSYQAIIEQVKPTHDVKVFDTNDLAVQALKNKQVDGIVVDVPTAFYMTAAQMDNGVIVGQLPAGSGTKEEFGAVLDKDSPLTGCVSEAVDTLRADGTLAELQKTWLTQAGAAELK